MLGIHGTTVFARKVAKQSTMGDCHMIAVIDAQGSAILFLILGSFAILQATIVKFDLRGLVGMYAVPSASSRVIDMEPRCVDDGEKYGVVLVADGMERSSIQHT